MNKLRLNDEVVVIAGKDKGKKGKVLKIFEKKNRVLVEGVNTVKKAIRPTQENPAGGITDIEATIHLSNIALVCPKTGGPTRVKIEDKNGKKVRIAVKSGQEIK